MYWNKENDLHLFQSFSHQIKNPGKKKKYHTSRRKLGPQKIHEMQKRKSRSNGMREQTEFCKRVHQKLQTGGKRKEKKNSITLE